MHGVVGHLPFAVLARGDLALKLGVDAQQLLAAFGVRGQVGVRAFERGRDLLPL